jgi:hypothetical protein
MSVAQFPSYHPSFYRRGRLVLLTLVVLGLMSFAAVGEMAGQCRTEQTCIEASNAGSCIEGSVPGSVIRATETTRCELTAGGWLRIALSQQAADILRRLGVPISYIGS